MCRSGRAPGGWPRSREAGSATRVGAPGPDSGTGETTSPCIRGVILSGARLGPRNRNRLRGKRSRRICFCFSVLGSTERNGCPRSRFRDRGDHEPRYSRCHPERSAFGAPQSRSDCGVSGAEGSAVDFESCFSARTVGRRQFQTPAPPRTLSTPALPIPTPRPLLTASFSFP
jgi:hypothetical protein